MRDGDKGVMVGSGAFSRREEERRAAGRNQPRQNSLHNEELEISREKSFARARITALMSESGPESRGRGGQAWRSRNGRVEEWTGWWAG